MQEQRFFERLLTIHTLEDLNTSTPGGTTNIRGIFNISPSVLKHGMDYRDHSFSCADFLLLKVVVFDLADRVPHIISYEKSNGVKSVRVGGQDFGAPLSIYPLGMYDECDSSRCDCSGAVPRLVGIVFEVVALKACSCTRTAGLANFNPQNGT